MNYGIILLLVLLLVLIIYKFKWGGKHEYERSDRIFRKK